MIECLRTCACLCLFSHGSWMASAIIRLWRKCLQREMLQANSENVSSKSEDWKNIGQVSATTPMFCLMQATCSAVSAKMCPVILASSQDASLGKFTWKVLAGACGLVMRGPRRKGASVVPTSTKDCYQVNQTPTAQVMIFPLKKFTSRAIQNHPSLPNGFGLLKLSRFSTKLRKNTQNSWPSWAHLQTARAP